MKTHHLTLLASLSLGACAPREAIAPAASSGIDLGVITLAEAEPAVRESCEASVHRALLRHGFTRDPNGPHVDVEVSFFQDPDQDTTGEYAADVGPGFGSASVSPMTRHTGYTADLTATIQLGRATRKVLSSGTAQRTEQARSLLPTGGPSRISACAMAAERLATGLVEEINRDAR